jgi:hypothetical protein
MFVSDTAARTWKLMAPALDEWTRADELLVMRLLFSAFPLRMFMCACDVTASLRESAVKKPVHMRICMFILLCARIHTMHINLSCYFDAAFFIQIRLFPTFGFGARRAFPERCRFIPHAESLLLFH